MDETMRDAIKAARNSLDKLDDLFETLADDLPEQAQDVQKRSRVVMEKIRDELDKAADRAEVGAQEAQVQAHLGVMEATDFWETRGKDMSEEFKKSAEQMASVATDAATDLQSRLERWVKTFEPKP